MATPTTREELLELLRKSGVLKPDALQKFLDEHPELPNEPKAVVSLFLQSKLLTPFQAKLLLAGRYKGFRLGAYVLLGQLGQGGMGAVYLAEHDTLHRKAAIKVLPPGGNKITVERFLREARAAAALDHPNIVRMHDVGREGEVHFLVMEYVEGQTLDKLVSSSAPLPAQRAVEYVAQTCAGLQHAFERGFIHRDIKPANLILAKDGTIKILDMGLARSNEKHDQLTQNLDAGAIVGTADYISPEQAISDSGVDIRTDIYSLGATFFAIVTGRPPFDGPTASKLVQHQVKDPPSVTTLDRTFPKGLSVVIAKMMAKKPSDRYSTPAEVIDALEPWQNESAQLMAGVSQTLAGKTASMSKHSGKLNKSSEPKLGSNSKPAKRSPRYMLWGAVSAGVVLGIVSAVVLVLRSGDQNAKVSPPPSTEPAALNQSVPTNRKVTPAQTPNVLYRLDLGEGKPIVVTTATSMSATLTDRKDIRESGRVGSGALPPGWIARSNIIGLECETEVAMVDDQPALGFRTSKASGSTSTALNTSLYSAKLQVPAGHVKLSFEYKSSSISGKCMVKFRPDGGTAYYLPAVLLSTNEWKRYVEYIDLTQISSGVVEITNGLGVGNALWIRDYTVSVAEPEKSK